MEIPEPAQIIIQFIAKFLIAYLKQGICLRDPYYSAVYHFMLFNKPEMFHIFNSYINKPFITFVPYPVALKTEKLRHNKRLAFRSHPFAPVSGFVDSSKRYLLLRDVNPCLVCNPFSVNHYSHYNNVPELQF